MMIHFVDSCEFYIKSNFYFHFPGNDAKINGSILHLEGGAQGKVWIAGVHPNVFTLITLVLGMNQR